MGSGRSVRIGFDQELDRQQAAAEFIVQHAVQSAGDACLKVFFPHLTGLVVEEFVDRGGYVLRRARSRRLLDYDSCAEGYCLRWRDICDGE